MAASSQPLLTIAVVVDLDGDGVAQSLASAAEIADELLLVRGPQSPPCGQAAGEHVRQVEASETGAAALYNRALDAANGEWVLLLEAGETLTPDNAKGLKRHTETAAVSGKAYLLLVAAPAAAGQIAGEQAARLRLAPRGARIRFEGCVDPDATDSLVKLNWEMTGLPWRIDRPVHSTERPHLVARAARRLPVLEQETREQGASSRRLNLLGEALQALGHREKAALSYRKSLELAEHGSADMLEAYYGLLTALDGPEPSRQQQFAICLEALESYPLDSQLLCAMGGYLQAEGRLDLAARSYETAWRYGQAHPLTWHLSELDQIAALCFALALQLQGKLAEAEAALGEAHQSYPDSTRIQRQLLDLHVRNGNEDEALALADKLEADAARRDCLRAAIRGAVRAGEKKWEEALPYLESAYQAGCRNAVCLRWLCVALAAQERRDEALEIVAQWRNDDPASTEAAQMEVAVAGPLVEAPVPSPLLAVAPAASH